MTSAVSPSRFNDHGFAWALALSIALHVLLVSAMHPFRFDTPAPAASLEIELQPPKPEPPPPPPKVVKPQEPPKPEPVPVRQTLPKKPLPEPPPVKLPQPVPDAPRVEAPPPPPPTIIAAAPKEEPPTFTAPPPEPVKPTGPTQQDIDAARSNYSSLLGREFAKYRQYPRIAQIRSWQGTAKVELDIDAAGNIVSISIRESSGFEALDKQALEMVRKANPLPTPPEALRNRQFNILVPVTFRLE